MIWMKAGANITTMCQVPANWDPLLEVHSRSNQLRYEKSRANARALQGSRTFNQAQE